MNSDTCYENQNLFQKHFVFIEFIPKFLQSYPLHFIIIDGADFIYSSCRHIAEECTGCLLE